jgi:hypothetical protein
MKNEPKLKNVLNLFGAMSISGKKVKAKNRNKQPITKNTPNA